jgi:oligopeptide transport system substrate-binding protein
MVRRPLLALTAILLIGLSLTACQPQRVARAACPAGKLCLEYGNTAESNSLDPQMATTTSEAGILRELFEGMFTDGPGGAPIPGVAKSWETSPDGLVWTFHLRDETWSDGEPVTAGDFVYAYQRMLNPKTGSPYSYLLYVLKNAQAVNAGKLPLQSVGARALDDHTLQLTLEHPASYLPQILKHQAFFPIPAHLVRVVGDRWVKPGIMVGNGAFTFTQWRLGDYARLVKNPVYRDADKVCFDRVDFVPTADPVSAERRVLRGELDVNTTIQSNRVPKLLADPAAAPYVRSHPFLLTGFMIFNTRDVPALRDRRVRQAISMSIDRGFITDKLLRAGQIPSASFVPHGIAGYLPKDAPHPQPVWADWSVARRQAAARQLLDRAGYGASHPLKLELKTTNLPGSLNTAQSVQADLKLIGVRVTFRQEDGAVVFESFNLRDFQLGLAGWVADFNDPMTFLGLMKSDTGQQNYGDFNNPAYDALLKAADNEADAARRAVLMARAEQLMLDDANVAPFDTGVNLNLVDPRITGWVDNDADIHPIRYLCRNDARGRQIKPAP